MESAAPIWPATELSSLLARSFSYTRDSVAEVTDDDLARGTPCSSWSLAALLAHTIGVIAGMRFTAEKRLAGENETQVFGASDAGAVTEVAGLIDIFDRVSSTTLAAWSAPGALEGETPLPVGFSVPSAMAAGINVFDTLVHGWDIRTALGRPAAMPTDLAEDALAIARTIVSDDVRALVGFDPPVEVASRAPATDRLVAFLGRHP